MKLLGSIIALAMILAALRVAFAVLALVLIGMFLWSLITKPGQTMTFMAVVVLFNLAGQYPLAAMGLISLAIIAAVVMSGEGERDI